MSCNQNERYRIDLSESIEYIETPKFFTVNKVSELSDFKPLKKEDMKYMNKLLEDKDNYLWLKINFTIPNELINEDLGLFIGQLKTADKAWINLIPCGSYGRFPPYELPANYGAQHFSLEHSVLKKQGINTIYIQVWTGCPINLSKKIFIGKELDTYISAERNSFFYSKIILCFVCVSLLAFFLYLLLHIFLRKFSTSKTYLYYSILMLFTVITILPFCLYEIPWIKSIHLSYFTIINILLSVGIYSTIYISNKFIISYLGFTETKTVRILRIIFYLIPLIATLMIKDNSNNKGIMYIFPIIFIQFIFTAQKVIKSIEDQNKKTHTILLLSCTIPAVIGFVIDLFSNKFINLQTDLPIASIYGWQITIYIFIIRLLKSFSYMYIKNTKLKNDMVKFNAKLESEVEIRTKELSEKNFILLRGLEAITLVQQEVLPKQNKTFVGWDIAVEYIPLDNEVSGDLYDYYFTGSKLNGLSIIDISGHGIPAGLMSILAKGIISQQYLDGIEKNKPMSEVLSNINQIYIKEKVNVENYFTGLIFNFNSFNDEDICKIQLANAGHPAPVLYCAADDSIREIKYKNPEEQYGFIGVEDFPVSFPATDFSMAQNDVLVCFTDGIIEAMNEEKEEFSKERLFKAIQESKHLEAEEIKENIMKELDKFVGTKHYSDDLTLIVLKRNNSKEYIEEI